jgi:hypothetical protein
MEELAELAGLSSRAVWDLECGRTRRPRRSTIDALRRALPLDDVQARQLATAARLMPGTAAGIPDAQPLSSVQTDNPGPPESADLAQDGVGRGRSGGPGGVHGAECETRATDHGLCAARTLYRAGRWDQALAILPAEEESLRAQILTERFWWRLDDPAEAEAAVVALALREPVLARFLASQLAYTRVVHATGVRPGDAEQLRVGFAAAAANDGLAGWGSFWLGVTADNVDHDPAKAAAAYAPALDWAREQHDWLLESYVVRHLGHHALRRGDPAGLELLRRSYYLRAALGARPQTAAAALTLSAALPSGPEAVQLREAAEITACELQLTWLLTELPRTHLG